MLASSTHLVRAKRAGRLSDRNDECAAPNKKRINATGSVPYSKTTWWKLHARLTKTSMQVKKREEDHNSKHASAERKTTCAPN